MEEHFEFLRKHPIFIGFTDEEIEQALVEFDYKIKSYKNDEIIVSSGRINKYSAFVLEGAAQLQKFNSDEKGYARGACLADKAVEGAFTAVGI